MSEPLVVIITPVFDGGDMLQGCIDSVRAQTYSNWRLIIADNASSDDTPQVALRAAASDSGRIRLERHREHLGMLENWNRGLAHAPEDAAYVKQLNVDDRMRPECLRRLVDTAEAHPQAGAVSSYFRYGTKRLPDYAHDAVQIVGGRTVVREVLMGGPTHLAHPSAMLLRRTASSAWPAFFDTTGFPPRHPLAPPLCQADKEAYFEVMQRFDLAFVPEVLTDVSANDASATGFSARVAAWHVCRIETILRHGEHFLDPRARRWAIRNSTRKYLRSLVWRFCKGAPLRDPEFVRYQRLALAYILPRLESEAVGWETAGLRWAARTLGRGRGVESELLT